MKEFLFSPSVWELVFLFITWWWNINFFSLNKCLLLMALVFRVRLNYEMQLRYWLSAIWYDGMLSLISFSGCAGDINSVQWSNTLCPRVISIYSYQLSWDNTENREIRGGRAFRTDGCSKGCLEVATPMLMMRYKMEKETGKQIMIVAER